MIGIGIDTGGTCTDAVIYDTENRNILAWAKDLTTKRDLKIGISKVLKKLPEDKLRMCTQVALSTTLATNACVENIGGNGKLIFIGVDEDILQAKYTSYGFQTLEDIYLLKCKITDSVKESEQPDWMKFQADMNEFLTGCDCVSIVQLFSSAHVGSYEKKAAKLIRESFDIPIILGKDLFLDLNALRRGAGALLNAQLVPVIYQFIQAIGDVFHSLHIDMPTTIIRSDGSQMSKEFAALHPVETLLSGPAASIVGGLSLTDVKQALIIDMGGTTTDIAIINDHTAKKVDKGIQIGNWKTFVKGVYIDTFGLGGDTAIHYNKSEGTYLENYRIIPLCNLAEQYPSVLTQLRSLACSNYVDSGFCFEFLYLLRDIEEEEKYNKEEKALCQIIKKEPLSIKTTATVLQKEDYMIKSTLPRLEEDGIIIRSGLTPTDIMHLKGDYTEYCTQASKYAATIFARSYCKGDIGELCDSIYELVEKRLYENIARILLTTECDALAEGTLSAQTQSLIHFSYLQAKGRIDKKASSFSTPLLQLKSKLVGVGAPMHLFLPKVAQLFDTEAILPKHASVANAIGAIAGKISVTVDVTLSPCSNYGKLGYDIITAEDKATFMDYDEACAFAQEKGTEQALQKAQERGAGAVSIESELISDKAKTGYGTIWIKDTYHFTATGHPSIEKHTDADAL